MQAMLQAVRQAVRVGGVRQGGGGRRALDPLLGARGGAAVPTRGVREGSEGGDAVLRDPRGGPAVRAGGVHEGGAGEHATLRRARQRQAVRQGGLCSVGSCAVGSCAVG
eukprot:1179015-Prorocentrum_minimum.AAC.1